MKFLFKFGIILVLIFFFTVIAGSCFGSFFKSVPMIDDAKTQLYIETSNEVSKDKVFVDWRPLIAIDAVRYQQDYSKATKESIAELANKFIKEEKKNIYYDLSNYVNTINRLSSEKGLQIDWRYVVMLDSITTKGDLNSSPDQIYNIGSKFIKHERIPEHYTEWVDKPIQQKYKTTIQVWEWVKHEEEEEYQEWEPYIDIFPWFGRYVTKTRTVEYYTYELVTKEVERTRTVIIKELVDKVRYIDKYSVKDINTVLLENGYSMNSVADKFKNVNDITKGMLKEIQITYTLVPTDVVLQQLGFNDEQKTDFNNYLNVGLAMNDVNSTGQGASGGGGKPSESATAFIARIAPGAIKGYKQYKVLPSITIAQAILESEWGRSGLTVKANNLFGIKAYNWNGPYVEMQTAEYYNGQKVMEMAKFRQYMTLDDSILDHGKFLNDNIRYRQAGLFNATNYTGQAIALRAAGYATDYNYPTLLMGLIMQYNLEQYDKQAQLGI
jgi:flagellum-specific peptidoglycan hydrolase FlgJ